MKKYIVFLFFIITYPNLYSQVNFKWDYIDSIPRTKDQIYSDAKLFISELWNSAKDVIQLDDKENGIIVIKGLTTNEMNFQLNNHIWIYAYTVKLYMKDYKFRITIDNVHCITAVCRGINWPLMPVADNYPEKKGRQLTGLDEKRYNSLMAILKADLQLIVSKYVSHIKKTENINNDW